MTVTPKIERREAPFVSVGPGQLVTFERNTSDNFLTVL